MPQGMPQGMISKKYSELRCDTNQNTYDNSFVNFSKNRLEKYSPRLNKTCYLSSKNEKWYYMNGKHPYWCPNYINDELNSS